MLLNVSRYRSVLIVVVVTACISIRANTAPAQPIYFEGFDDDVLRANTMIVNSTIARWTSTLGRSRDGQSNFFSRRDISPPK